MAGDGGRLEDAAAPGALLGGAGGGGGEDGSTESSSTSGDDKLQDHPVASDKVFAMFEPVGRKKHKDGNGKGDADNETCCLPEQ